MNRESLKFSAKDAMRAAPVNPYVVTIIQGIITLVLSFVQTGMDTWGKFLSDPYSYVDTAQRGTYMISSILFFVITFVVTTILNTGYHAYCLKVANRDTSMAYGDLFSSVRYLLKALGLSIMVGILTFLWTLLFIIPGIIAAYRYSQAIFVLVEDPKKGVMQCIQESKEMMVGNKFDYFVLELSFILWNFLGIATCGLGMIYVTPYTMVTYANYYNEIKPETPNKEADVVWP